MEIVFKSAVELNLAICPNSLIIIKKLAKYRFYVSTAKKSKKAVTIIDQKENELKRDNMQESS